VKEGEKREKGPERDSDKPFKHTHKSRTVSKQGVMSKNGRDGNFERGVRKADAKVPSTTALPPRSPWRHTHVGG